MKGKNDELVKELVTLSRRHGVLTPYTSFMADENSRTHDVTTLYREAGRRLESLSEVEGQLGVEQRATKAALRSASAPADGGFYAGNGAGGLGSSDAKAAGGGQPAGRGFYFKRDSDKLADNSAPVISPAVLSLGGAVASERGGAKPTDEEGAKIAENVRSIGRKVFYRRGDRWVDSTVTAEQEKQPIKIERYSKEYFDLIDKFGRDVAKYMTFDDPVVIELDGKAYSF